MSGSMATIYPCGSQDFISFTTIEQDTLTGDMLVDAMTVVVLGGTGSIGNPFSRRNQLLLIDLQASTFLRYF